MNLHLLKEKSKNQARIYEKQRRKAYKKVPEKPTGAEYSELLVPTASVEQ